MPKSTTFWVFCWIVDRWAKSGRFTVVDVPAGISIACRHRSRVPKKPRIRTDESSRRRVCDGKLPDFARAGDAGCLAALRVPAVFGGKNGRG